MNNTLSGSNFGIYVDLVAGANSLLIEGNNITNADGCIYMNGGETDPRIIANNFESVVANNSTDRALVVLKGASGILRLSTIAFNTFSMLGGYALIGLLIDNARYSKVEGNYFGRSDAINQKGWVTTAIAKYNFIGDNWITGATIDTGYTDGGLGTKGIYKNITYATGYADHATNELSKYIVDNAGMVHLIGEFNNSTGGAWTDSTIVATLPVNVRPLGNQFFPATCFITNTGYSTVSIKIDTSGNIRMYGVASKTVAWISLCGIAFHAYY
jgi:hypothetical protein